MCRIRDKAFVLTLSLTRPIRECPHVGSEMSRKMSKIDVKFSFGKRCRHHKNARCSPVGAFTIYVSFTTFYSPSQSRRRSQHLTHQISSSSATNNHSSSLCDPPGPKPSPRGTESSFVSSSAF